MCRVITNTKEEGGIMKDDGSHKCDGCGERFDKSDLNSDYLCYDCRNGDDE